jgi:hypothetical protein
VPTRGAVAITAAQDFSRSRALGDQDFDSCFAGWDGSATIVWPARRARASPDPPLDHMILFAPPGKPFFALEPVSGANNASNLAELGSPDAGCACRAADLRGVFRLTVEKSEAGPLRARTGQPPPCRSAPTSSSVQDAQRPTAGGLPRPPQVRKRLTGGRRVAFSYNERCPGGPAARSA